MSHPPVGHAACRPCCRRLSPPAATSDRRCSAHHTRLGGGARRVAEVLRLRIGSAWRKPASALLLATSSRRRDRRQSHRCRCAGAPARSSPQGWLPCPRGQCSWAALAKTFGARRSGVVLSGMGSDGASGLAAVSEAAEWAEPHRRSGAPRWSVACQSRCARRDAGRAG